MTGAALSSLLLCSSSSVVAFFSSFFHFFFFNLSLTICRERDGRGVAHVRPERSQGLPMIYLHKFIRISQCGGKWGGRGVISAGCLNRQRGEKGKEVGLGASSCLNKRMYLYTIR